MKLSIWGRGVKSMRWEISARKENTILSNDVNKARQRRKSFDWGNQTWIEVVQTRFETGIHARLHCTLAQQLYTSESIFGQHSDILGCS